MAGNDRRARRARPPVAEEQPARVGARRPGRRRSSRTARARRWPEAVLDRPQQAQGVVAVALEGQHGVDHVLEHPGTGQGAVLGDVADEDGRQAPLPWPAATRRVGAAPDLGHRARGRRPASGSHTVWIESTTSTSGSTSLDRGRRSPGSEVSATSQSAGHQGAEPLGPHADLLGRLLGRHEQAPGPAGGQRGQGLEQQGRLADAGLAAEQGDRPGTSPPPSTRSSSPIPVGAGSAVSASTSARATGSSAGRTGRARGRSGEPAGARSPRAPRPACSTRRRSGTGRPTRADGTAVRAAVDAPAPGHGATLKSGCDASRWTLVARLSAGPACNRPRLRRLDRRRSAAGAGAGAAAARSPRRDERRSDDGDRHDDGDPVRRSSWRPGARRQATPGAELDRPTGVARWPGPGRWTTRSDPGQAHVDLEGRAPGRVDARPAASWAGSRPRSAPRVWLQLRRRRSRPARR